MSEKQITVEVAGSVYPLKINTNDESSIREAVELINIKIAEFERNYAIKDRKEVMGMVMLQLVSQLYKRANTSEQELSHLKQLFADVEVMLKEHIQGIKNIDQE